MLYHFIELCVLTTVSVDIALTLKGWGHFNVHLQTAMEVCLSSDVFSLNILHSPKIWQGYFNKDKHFEPALVLLEQTAGMANTFDVPLM